MGNFKFRRLLPYFASLSLFKFAIGALLLLMGWDAIVGRGAGLPQLAMNIVLAFAPATFAKPLFARLAARSEVRGIAFSLMAVAALLPFEPHLFSKSLPLFSVVHMAVWTLIFCAEAGFEAHFVRLCKQVPASEATRLSGRSMTTIQLAVIAGPIAVPFLRGLQENAPYFVCAIAFLSSGAFIFASRPVRHTVNQTNKFIESLLPQKELRTPTLMEVLALGLIWPTVAIFHMFIPLAASKLIVGPSSVNIAAWAEALFGLSIAGAGIYLSSSIKGPHCSLASLPSWLGFLVGASLLVFSGESIFFLTVGMFIVAWYFGVSRIQARTSIASRYSAAESAKLFSNANAWSGLLVLIAVLLFAVERTLLAGYPGLFLLPATLGVLTTAIIHSQFNPNSEMVQPNG